MLRKRSVQAIALPLKVPSGARPRRTVALEEQGRRALQRLSPESRATAGEDVRRQGGEDTGGKAPKVAASIRRGLGDEVALHPGLGAPQRAVFGELLELPVAPAAFVGTVDGNLAVFMP